MGGHPGMQLSGVSYVHLMAGGIARACWCPGPAGMHPLGLFGAGSVLPTEFLPGVPTKHVR